MQTLFWKQSTPLKTEGGSIFTAFIIKEAYLRNIVRVDEEGADKVTIGAAKGKAEA